MFHRLADALAGGRETPFTHAVVDEAQDLSPAELRFLGALAGRRADGLFLAGDIGQRIFRAPFAWKTAGVDVRGRSRTLKVNYRTTHQIRRRADVLLPADMSDGDGTEESRRGVVSVFEGPEPAIRTFADPEAESAAVADWLAGLIAAGIGPGEVGVFVRSVDQISRAAAALEGAGIPHHVLTGSVDLRPDRASVSTMHVAKGLEFRAVAVMACDEAVLPLESRIRDAGDESELREVYDTERHLLYVASTRARERLHVSGVAPVSEFLMDVA
jgi:superfamily I DNA/RNA helicase